MEKTVKLLTTDSYYGIFALLNRELEGKTHDIDRKNFVFCEEKISLMAERAICNKFGGSFNTEVYSFGNYLKKRKNIEALSREGSAMAVKRILGEVKLQTLKAGKADLAPSLFDLIVQLKSANVSPESLKKAANVLEGERAKKIKDVAEVFAAYEKFISDNNFIDQSGVLSFLPEEIIKDERIKTARVYLLGYDSWTRQARDAVATLIENANETTAILTGGENNFLYLNETVEIFKKICAEKGVDVVQTAFESYTDEHVLKLSNEAFNPKYRIDKRTYTDKIVHLKLKSPDAEAEHVAESVAKGVRQGLRYRDFTVAVPSTTEYGRKLKYHFDLLSIPYFIDEKINPSCHPLVRLIFAYFDVFRKNFERKSVTDFYKNPLFCEDKKLTDFMEVYCNKFNVNYDRFKKPFTLGEKDEVNKAENFRRELLTVLDKFNIFVLLDRLRVKEKVEEFTGKLSSVGETVTSQVNAQVYDAVIRILNDMQRILSAWQTEFTGSKALTEMKNVFKSGIEALELSVIPQYGDAVYVGDYRKTALARAKNLFALGLTSSVPAVKDDVAVLSDDDIKALENENLNIDPTVRIVNLRAKENFGVAMLAFSDKLYLSCPQVDGGGKKTVKSDFIAYVLRLFDCRNENGRSKNPNEPEPYLSKRQGAISFAKDCRAFANGRINEESMKQAHAYREIFGDEGTDKILEKAKSELSPKYKLDGIEVKLPDYSSPTKIEDFYDCPYKAFAARILRLKENDDGSISAPIAGTFMHALFEKYFESFDKIKDKATSDDVFNEALNKTIENPDFKKFFEDKENGALIDRIISEAKKYCYKSYLSLIEPNDEENGSFVPIALEKKFSYKLPETGFKLVGTVDRIDVLKQNGKEVKKDNKPTVRIIDYKSGKADASDKLLYVGKKLQLYLYAAAFEADFVAGLYYATVKDEYLAEKDKSDFMAIGKTVNDENIIALTEKEKEGTLPFAKTKFRANSSNEGLVSADVLKSCVKYAVTMCENAVKQISDGVMIASPYSGACDYCKYKGLCGKAGKYERKVSENVKATQIAGIIDGDTNDGE